MKSKILKRRESLRKIIVSVLMTLITIFATAVYANTSKEISNVPLFAVRGVAPNVFFLFDDSGSMQWSFMPEQVFYAATWYGYTYENPNPAVKSSHYNGLYYNPDKVYQPPIGADGESLGQSNFYSAWFDGYSTNRDAQTIDLSNNFVATFFYPNEYGGYLGAPEWGHYYVLDENYASYYWCSNPAHAWWPYCYKKQKVRLEERENFANWYSYYRNRLMVAKGAIAKSIIRFDDSVRIGYTTINKDQSFTGFHPVSPFNDASRESFYSWIFGLQALGSTPLRAAIEEVGKYFQTTGPDNPYRESIGDSNSPLRGCRQTFTISISDGTWNGTSDFLGNFDNTAMSIPVGGADPNYPNPLGITSYSPGQAYNNIFSDRNVNAFADHGFYFWATDLQPNLRNNMQPIIIDRVSDIDGNGVVDEQDIFWNPRNDPANWQHMNILAIGFGVNGYLDSGDSTFSGDYNNLLTGTQYDPVNGKDWGDLLYFDSDSGTMVLDFYSQADDIWHGSINSRGRYLNAKNPSEFVDVLNRMIEAIISKQGSSAAISLTSGSVSGGEAVFQAAFDFSEWTGSLVRRELSTGEGECAGGEAGGICPEPTWEAGCVLDRGKISVNHDVGETTFSCSDRQFRDPNTRVILTMNPAKAMGVPFRWDSLSDAQRAQFMLPNDSINSDVALQRLNYLRGDKSKEGEPIYQFRYRSSLLGDIVNAGAIYVGSPNRNYSQSQFGSPVNEPFSYETFKSHYANRREMIYVGANDGMLHGFDARTGEEVFGFVPNGVYSKLAQLTRFEYVHESFVDGRLTVEDAQLSDGWASVLVAGLGLGGRSVFALDVTDPAQFTTERSAASKVLWEYTDSELGYLLGSVKVTRVRLGANAEGRWVAVFGNGYNNPGSQGNAVLFVVDLATGELIRKISTQIGAADDPEGISRINGLADVVVADVNGDEFADYVYGGDLFGNLWKFSLQANNATAWSVGDGVSSESQPLFRAVDATGKAQPFTTGGTVSVHPTGEGQMIYFGTGSYLGRGDINDTAVQTLYGIWDRNNAGRAPILREHLLEQRVLGRDDKFGSTIGVIARAVSNYPISWYSGKAGTFPVYGDDEYLGWRLDLPELGERVHYQPVLRNGQISFVTVTPSRDPCEGGGSSWLMELNATSGGRISNGVFDLNGDLTFDQQDLLDLTDPVTNAQVAASGVRTVDNKVYSGAVAVQVNSSLERRLVGTSEPGVYSVTVRGIPRYPSVWRELLDE